VVRKEDLWASPRFPTKKYSTHLHLNILVPPLRLGNLIAPAVYLGLEEFLTCLGVIVLFRFITIHQIIFQCSLSVSLVVKAVADLSWTLNLAANRVDLWLRRYSCMLRRERRLEIVVRSTSTRHR